MSIENEVSEQSAKSAKQTYVAPRLVQIGDMDMTEGKKGNKNTNEKNYAKNAVS